MTDLQDLRPVSETPRRAEIVAEGLSSVWNADLVWEARIQNCHMRVSVRVCYMQVVGVLFAHHGYLYPCGRRGECFAPPSGALMGTVPSAGQHKFTFNHVRLAESKTRICEA